MRALIVDDERMPAGQLEAAISRSCPKITSVKHICNPIEALGYLRSQMVDVLFLDVEMPEMSGFEFIDLADPASIPPVIFTTAFNKYAVDAFRANAVDYLLKPINKKELAEAVGKVENVLHTEQQQALNTLIDQVPDQFGDRLALAEGQSYHFVEVADIVHIRGHGSYSDFFFTEDRKLTSSKRLKVYQERLQGKRFVRVHQSYIVNLKYVLQYSKSDGGELLMENGHRIPVSTGYRAEVQRILGLK